MQGVDPVGKMGETRWYDKPNPNHIYSLTLDPSSGTGGDNAAIQIMNVSTMTQVGEWAHNRTPVEGQMRVMMEMLIYLRDNGCKNLYWTVENNTIGEAALVVIRDTGEENFPGDFLHDPKKIAGKRGRKGFHTGHRSKMEACLNFKRLLEQDRIHIKSKVLISELKNFVSRGNSFKAKPGEMDDLVMAMMLNVRMINYISTFEDAVYSVVHSGIVDNDDYDDEGDQPLPVGFL
jgi:hypothetical protein